MPSDSLEDGIDFAQPLQKIRKIETPPAKSMDVVWKLRASWLGRLYTSRLNQYSMIRWVAHWIWRNGYPVYINYVATKKSPQIPLVKLSKFAKKNGLPVYALAEEAVLKWSEPRVFPAVDQGYLAPSQDHSKFPKIYVAALSSATTYGGTNLVLSGGAVVCHDLYDFGRDYTSEELHGRTLIDPKANRIRWLLRDETPEHIPVAATFVDACAANYAHWMTEVLPRIVLFCADDRFRGVPVVVNDGLHKNIMESLFLVTGAEREILTLPIGRALTVDQLYVTSVTGYVPFGRRTNKLSGHSEGLFSPWSFGLLREQVGQLGGKTERHDWPDKIYLSRNSGARKVVNAAEIEKLLFAKGYVAVEPEALTFLQQIQLFRHAREIVSPTGAALVNALACKPGTQVAILMSKHKDMIYGYWNNLLSPFGIKVSYVLGSIVENHDLGIHGDFVVDVKCIGELLESFEKR